MYIQPMSLPVGLIFYLDYPNSRELQCLEEAGVKVWKHDRASLYLKAQKV